MVGFLGGGLSGGGSAPVPFNGLLSFATSTHTTVPNGSGAVAIGLLAGDTPTPGSEARVALPAGSFTSLYVDPELNVGGDCIPGVPGGGDIGGLNTSLDYELVATYLTSGVVSVLRQLQAHGASAPTVGSVVIDTVNAPDKLVVEHSGRMIYRDLSGLSLPFTNGTPRTVTGIASGNGTTTVTFQLSGNVLATDALSYVVGAARTGQDLHKNLLTTGTTAVTLTQPGLATQAAWAYAWEAGRDMLPASPGNFTSWKDQVGKTVQLVSALPGNATHAQTASDGVHFSGAAGERIHVTGVVLGAGDWTIFVRFKKTGNNQQAALSFDDGTTNHRVMIYITLGTHAVANTYDGTHAPSPDDNPWTIDDNFHNVFVDFDHTTGTVSITVDGRGTVSQTVAGTAFSGLTELTVGAANLAGEFYPLQGAVWGLALKNTAQCTGAEKTNTLAYVAAHA